MFGLISWTPSEVDVGGGASARPRCWFYPVDADGQVSWGSGILASVDQTTGDSGACGINNGLAIALPFRMEKSG